MFEESAWVFKWFMTCYLNDFPLEMCQFVMDLVVCTGGLGLVKFAIALLIKLEKCLLEIGDAYDLTLFFGKLKEVDTFNSYLSIKEIIETTYLLQIQRDDLKDLAKAKPEQTNPDNMRFDFYAQYILIMFEEDLRLRPQQPNNPFTSAPLLVEDPSQPHSHNPT
jgi:hypothetical protein